MILVSRCLSGAFCRWDGGTNLVPEIASLVENGLAITACPEELGGLPTPREPSEKLRDRVISRLGIDVTDEFNKGAIKTLLLCQQHGCHLAIMKAKSPSCGKGFIHNGKFDGGLVSGNGITTQLLLDHGIEVLTEDEWLNREKTHNPH